MENRSGPGENSICTGIPVQRISSDDVAPLPGLLHHVGLVLLLSPHHPACLLVSLGGVLATVLLV